MQKSGKMNLSKDQFSGQVIEPQIDHPETTEEEEKKKKGIIAWFKKHKKGVTILKRDVFLDSTDDINVVKKQIMQTAEIAKQKGYAIGIGHVGPEGGNITVQAIKELAPVLEKQGIVFVTVSQLNEIVIAQQNN